MLKRVEFQNYKSMDDIAIDFERFTILIGPNGCGKTSTLAAIDDIIRFDKDLNTKNISFPDEANKRNKSNLIIGKLYNQRSQSILISSKTTNNLYEKKYENNKESSPIFEGIIFFTPALERIHSAVQLQPKPVISKTGFGVADVLADLSMNARPVFLQIESDLKKIVPNLSAIRIQRTPLAENMLGHSIALDMIGAGLLPASRLSEGTLISLALLTLLHSPERPGLILMDDIDRALHPKAQAELIGCIRTIMEANPELQIICTSHSPYLLDHFRYEEVRVMAIGRDGLTRCRGLLEHPRAAEFQGSMGAGEFWAMVGEDWVLDIAEPSAEAPASFPEMPGA